MKKFLAVYVGTPDAYEASRWARADDATRKSLEAQGMQAWGAWVEKHRTSIVENGAPLGRTKRVSSAGIADVRNAMAAYTIVQAESHEAAARLFENHPHFTIFPGTGVEIMECLPLPQG